MTRSTAGVHLRRWLATNHHRHTMLWCPPGYQIIDFEEDMDEELGLRFTFGLRTKARVYCIQASSQRDRARWVAAITDTIPALKAASAVRASGPRVSGAGGAAGAVASQ